MIDTSGIEITGDSTRERIVECEKFLDSVIDTDERERLLWTLNQAFDTLRRLAPDGSAKLYLDFAPLSFFFEAGGWKGGIIFHGPTDGSGPNYSVMINPFSGWSVHT